MPVEDVNFAPRSREVSAELQRLNKSRVTPLTRFQKQQIDEAKPIYIYNVSTIHEWNKPQGQLGTVMIPKCQKGQQVSKPYVLRGVIARNFDHGMNRREWFLESGMEVAEDIVGCSKEYPVESPNNNLANFGVFISEKPFEELPKKEQERLLDAAHARLTEKLRQSVLEADQFWAGPTQQHGWIGSIHRESLNALNAIMGTREDRPWAPIRHAERADDCKFCGTKVKPGVPVCPNCNHVLDEEKYEKMKPKKAS